MKKIISFASDFGLNDGSVGVVKGVINRVDPEIKVNDISHGIPAQPLSILKGKAGDVKRDWLAFLPPLHSSPLHI